MASVVSVVSFQPSFNVLSGYFYVSLNLTGILQFPNLAELSCSASFLPVTVKWSILEQKSGVSSDLLSTLT